jgi:hypothetical protein
MAHEDVPIQLFVNQRYMMPAVQKIVDGWRVEAHHVIDKLVEHFREMGIYRVSSVHEALIMKNLMHQLRNSPEILSLVQKARMEEQKRQRNRHAE